MSEPLEVQENIEGRTPEAEALAKFVAKRIVTSAKTPGLEEAELSNRIGEIEEETEILGADYLKVHIIDPDWNIMRSGLVDRNAEGFLNEVQVEFPEGSKRFWILCAVEGSNDITSANFRMTFQDRIFVKLRAKWGTKNVLPGTRTRAQFVRELLQEAGVPYLIPGINIVQPVEEEKAGEAGEKQIEAEQAKQQKEQKENKTPGLSGHSKVKVRGQEITKAQMTVANILLKTARGLGANQVATEALLFAGIAETNLGASGVSGGAHVGVLQGTASEWPNPNDTQGQAQAFLQGGKGFQAGGALALSKTSTNPVEIAVKVEAPSIWPANAYAEQSEYSTFLPSAEAILMNSGGMIPGAETSEAASDIGQLKRGTNANPDENSDECIKRLAQQVDWFGFSNGHRFFYMTGPELARQMPVAKVDVPGNHIITYKGSSKEGVVLSGTNFSFDNTTLQYRQTHKLKTRVQRRSKAVKPASPSEVKLHLICNIGEYLAGDVILFENSGPVNGRWIIVQTTRNCFKDIYTEILCEPPVEALPEPKESSKEEVPGTGENAAPEGEEGTATYQAKRALAEEKKNPGLYSYSQAADRENKGTLFGPKPRTMDCSSMVILAYKAANLPDPTGGNYSTPIGNTDSIIKNCEKVATPTKDDFCFFGASESQTEHVTLYIGGGKAIAMQAPGLNLGEGDAATFGPSGFLGYYRAKNY